MTNESLVSLTQFAEDLGVTKTRIREIISQLEAKDDLLMINRRVYLPQALREKILAFRNRPDFPGYRSTQGFCKHWDITLNRLYDLLDELKIEPNDQLCPPFLYIKKSEADQVAKLLKKQNAKLWAAGHFTE